MRCLGLLAAFVLGCGARTDPGSGTQTLLAQIEVSGKPDSTSIEVGLTARGNPVSGANVVFTDVDSGEQFTADAPLAGNYRVTMSGYPLALRVKITAGDNELEAQLEGPSPHKITTPPEDALVLAVDMETGEAFEFLVVRWEAERKASRVVVHPQGSPEIEINGDPLFSEIPLENLDSGDQQVGVTRETSVDLAGGAPGSQMRTRYRVDNRFTLER